MQRRHYTFLILRNDRDRFRQWKCSSRLLWGGAAAALAVVALLALGGYAFWEGRQQADTLAVLQSENDALRAEQARYDATITGITGRLNRSEAHAQRLAEALGVDDLVKPDPAAGGPGAVADASLYGRQLSSLAGRSAELDESLAELDRVFQQRTQLLAATPSAMPTSEKPAMTETKPSCRRARR